MLHERLSTDCGAARARIDAHLLACWLDPVRPDPMFVLSNTDTFHYHNLPDLSKYLRHALAVGDWGSNIISAFMAVFCLQLKKQKRTFQSTALVERTALVNLLHGLLLGLYPYNTRHMNFDLRIKIVGELRIVMCSGSQLEFILDHEELIHFAVVEYLANVLPDFMPVEDALLVKGMQSRFSINQVCETFRVAATEVVESSATMWTDLNKLAKAQLPALHRQLKVSNMKIIRRQNVPRVPNAVWTTLASHGFYDRLLELPLMPMTGTNMIAQIKLLCPDFDFLQLQTLEYFWSNIMLCVLPRQTAEKQQKTLSKYGSCQTYQDALTHVAACLPCALKSRSGLLTQEFAYNCIDDILQCATCSRTVHKINMLGRVLTIRDVSYYLCSGCLRPTVWKGDMNMCSACESPSVRQDLSTCVACSKKTFEVVRKVIDVDTMRILSTPLCFHHAKYCVLAHSTIYDTKSLMKELMNTI